MPDPTPTPPPPTLTIQPTKGFSSLGLHELWHYRDLLRFQVLKEVKGKYRQMALGPLWIVLQPVINMLVLSFVFGKIAKLSSDGIPYPILTYSALIPWTFFANASMLSASCLVTEMNVISKVYFPRLILPLSYIIGRLVDFLVCFTILVIMLMLFGYYPTLLWLTIPAYLFLAVCTTLAISCWTASLTVKFRDIKFVVQYGVQVAMYLTPVAYTATRLPEGWMWLFKLNPMFWVIEGFRWALIGQGNGPELYMLWPISIVVVGLVTGAFVFRRTERTIVDLL
jgi:lipopolysaccharide transport system permease protein